MHRAESHEKMRQRMNAETSVYLTECLRHPELAVHIPMIPASGSRFPPSFSLSFWNPVLLD
jgi:hypothetical protein